MVNVDFYKVVIMHGRADGGSQEYQALYSIISDCLNGSLLWLTNFHNLVNPYMTIKDSGLRHFKDMDKPILIFKDINCLWFFSLVSFADYFHSKFASHCRCTKLSVQSGDAELQSEIVAKLLSGLSAGCEPSLQYFACGRFGAAAAAGWGCAGIRTVR